ncbi:MAG: hypothetical protein ACK5XN_30735 [Bacteroidota bacterium]
MSTELAVEEKPVRRGYKNVTRWQKVVIRKVWELKSRKAAAEELELSVKGLSDLLYRAFLVLEVDTIEEAITKIGA